MAHRRGRELRAPHPPRRRRNDQWDGPQDGAGALIPLALGIFPVILMIVLLPVILKLLRLMIP